MKFAFSMTFNKWIFVIFCLMGSFLFFSTIPSYGQSEKAGLYDTALSKPSTPGTDLSIQTPVFNESFTQGVSINSSATFPWTVGYDANVMPTEDGWSERIEGSSTAFAQNSVLFLSTPTYYGVARAFYRSWSATSSAGWTLEVRLRVVDEVRRSGYYQGIGLEMYTPEGVIWFEFEKDKVEFFGCCSGGPFFTVASHLMNTTDAFHTYRILGKGTKAFLYVDGNLALDISNALQPFGGLNRIYFGDDNNGPESGTAYWDYVSFYTDGAFAPGEFPGVTDIIKNASASANVIAPYKDIAGLPSEVTVSYELLQRALVNAEVQQNGVTFKKLFPLDVLQNKGLNSFLWGGIIDAEEISNTKLEQQQGRNDPGKIIANDGDYTIVIKATDARDATKTDSKSVTVKVISK